MAAAAVAAAAAETGPSRVLTAERYYAEITASTGALAGLVDGADLTLQVPTCPDWTLRQLATHVGRAQRWAAEIVSTRSPRAVAFRDVPDGRIPDDPAGHAGWLRAGADRLITVLGQAGDAKVWAFGEQRPAGFWARRMTHETTVHGVDAQLAAAAGNGQPRGDERPGGEERPAIAADVAADGIDEWLTVLAGRSDGEPDPRAAGLAAGDSLHVHAADVPDGTGEWVVSHDPDGITVRRAHEKATLALRGGASDLLLVLVQRFPPDDPAIGVHGDPALLRRWLAATRF
ncbi:MAG: maleylpyruvate isomerase family mycothiol-dependent enzyme [Streptosporangiaceae bacterium]